MTWRSWCGFFGAGVSTVWAFGLCLGLGLGCSGSEPATTAPPPTPDSGATTTTPPRDAGTTVPPADAGTTASCVDLTVYGDADGDGFGTSSDTQMACLLAGEVLDGYARGAGDCKPGDPLAYPGSEGVCGDFVDDDCSGRDVPCPTTQATTLDIPQWDCRTGTPPPNVVAWALFTSGRGYYRDNGCFMFFEGLPGEFYVRHTLAPVNQASSCFGRYGGCICPSTPSYDKRIMAFTLRGTVNDCPEIAIVDHGGISCNECFDQPTSNECRKYLYAMHTFFDIPFSYVGTLDGVRRRLESFPTIEIACVHNPPNDLPYFTLLTSSIQINPGFTAK